jgi:hypothetical protein
MIVLASCFITHQSTASPLVGLLHCCWQDSEKVFSKQWCACARNAVSCVGVVIIGLGGRRSRIDKSVLITRSFRNSLLRIVTARGRGGLCKPRAMCLGVLDAVCVLDVLARRHAAATMPCDSCTQRRRESGAGLQLCVAAAMLSVREPRALDSTVLAAG